MVTTGKRHRVVQVQSDGSAVPQVQASSRSIKSVEMLVRSSPTDPGTENPAIADEVSN